MNHKHVMMAVEQRSDARAVTSRIHRLDRCFNYATLPEKIRHNPTEWELKLLHFGAHVNPQNPEEIGFYHDNERTPIKEQGRVGNERRLPTFDLDTSSSSSQSKLKGFPGPRSCFAMKKNPVRSLSEMVNIESSALMLCVVGWLVSSFKVVDVLTMG